MPLHVCIQLLFIKFRPNRGDCSIYCCIFIGNTCTSKVRPNLKLNFTFCYIAFAQSFICYILHMRQLCTCTIVNSTWLILLVVQRFILQSDVPVCLLLCQPVWDGICDWDDVLCLSPIDCGIEFYIVFIQVFSLSDWLCARSNMKAQTMLNPAVKSIVIWKQHEIWR